MKYLKVVKDLEKAFESFSLVTINRVRNTIADVLYKWATTSGAVDTCTVVLMTANVSAIAMEEGSAHIGVISGARNWMGDIMQERSMV